MKTVISKLLFLVAVALLTGAVLLSPGCEGRSVTFPKIEPRSMQVDLDGQFVLTESGLSANAPLCVQVGFGVEFMGAVIPADLKICEVILYDKEEGGVIACLVASVSASANLEERGIQIHRSAAGLVSGASSKACERHFSPFRPNGQQLGVDIE